MTAEPDLLPLPAPDYLLPLGPGHGAISMWSENTIRQIVAHATAAKDAEVEALRAEVGDYRTNGAAAVRFAPNSAYWSNELRRLFGDDARTGIEVLENQYRQELARAERLAEALQRLVNSFPEESVLLDAGWDAAEVDEACEAYDAARAALEQETTNG